MDVDTNENFLRRKFNEHYEKVQAKKKKKRQTKIGVIEETEEQEVEALTTSRKIDVKK